MKKWYRNYYTQNKESVRLRYRNYYVNNSEKEKERLSPLQEIQLTPPTPQRITAKLGGTLQRTANDGLGGQRKIQMDDCSNRQKVQQQ